MYLYNSYILEFYCNFLRGGGGVPSDMATRTEP